MVEKIIQPMQIEWEPHTAQVHTSDNWKNHYFSSL